MPKAWLFVAIAYTILSVCLLEAYDIVDLLASPLKQHASLSKILVLALFSTLSLVSVYTSFGLWYTIYTLIKEDLDLLQQENAQLHNRIARLAQKKKHRVRTQLRRVILLAVKRYIELSQRRLA